MSVTAEYTTPHVAAAITEWLGRHGCLPAKMPGALEEWRQLLDQHRENYDRRIRPQIPVERHGVMMQPLDAAALDLLEASPDEWLSVATLARKVGTSDGGMAKPMVRLMQTGLIEMRKEVLRGKQMKKMYRFKGKTG